MRELIKSMREATAKSGLLDGAEGNLANDLLDQQLSVQMSGLPGGLSDAIQRQLSKQLGGDGRAALVPGSTLSLDTTLRKAAPADNPRARPKGRDDFVQHHAPPPSAWRRTVASPPASCWARPATRPAGAKARSATRTAPASCYDKGTL